MIDLLSSKTHLVSKLASILLELLAPTFCCHCGKVGLLLCVDCFSQIEYTPFITQLHTHVDSIKILTVASYAGPIRSLIVSMKFGGVIAVCPYLADLAAYALQPPTFDIICPIPLHAKRKKERGFDQAEKIARRLSYHYKKPVIQLLVRKKHLKAQSSVKNKALRLKRMQSIYIVNAKHLSILHQTKNMRVLLVDDVFTTGATMSAAAQVLFSHNPTLKVTGLCIAKD